MLTRRTLLSGALAALLWPRRLWAQPAAPSNLGVSGNTVMSIAVDTSADMGSSSGNSWTTGNYTCTGADGLLVLMVLASLTDDNITGATYNSVAMTLLNKQGVGDRWEYFFYLLGPATGAHTFTITAINNPSFIGAVAASYTGVAQTGQPDASTMNNGASPLTTTLTTVADNSWTILAARSTAALSAGTGSTQRQLWSNSTFGLYDSNGPVTPAGSYGMTVSAAAAIQAIMGSFAPAAGGAASVVTPRLLALLGVGA